MISWLYRVKQINCACLLTFFNVGIGKYNITCVGHIITFYWTACLGAFIITLFLGPASISLLQFTSLVCMSLLFS